MKPLSHLQNAPILLILSPEALFAYRGKNLIQDTRMIKPMKMKRKELFDTVWEKPVSRLTKEHGLSDVGLAKACRRHAIPLPPVGHWAKVAVGRGQPKPTLQGHFDEMVDFSGMPSLQKKPLSTELRGKLDNALALPGISVTANYDATLGPYTRRTSKALARKPDTDGFIFGKNDTFHVRVSAGSKGRVIRILNMLEISLAAAGMKWEQSEKHHGVVGRLLEETIIFDITEAYSRTEYIEKHPTYDWMNKRTYTYRFLGDLKIRIDGHYEGRKSWPDGKTQRLEEKLPQVIEGFIAAAEAMQRRTEELQAQHARWEEEAAIRREKERIAYERRQFLEGAVKEAKAWSEAKLLRQYVAYLRDVVSVSKADLTDYGKDWLSRAEEVANWLDPTEKWRGKGEESSDQVDQDE